MTIVGRSSRLQLKNLTAVTNRQESGASMPLNDEQVSTQGQARNQVNPWNPVAAIFRCWRWALPTGIVLAGVTAFSIISTFVPMYRATHILEANQEYKVFKGVNTVHRDLARTELQIIMNPMVLEPILSDPTLRSAPSLSDPATAETNLKKNIRISSGGNENRLVISYDDSDRVSAAMVCSAIVESYLSVRARFDLSKSSDLANFLMKETDRWQIKVKGLQDLVKDCQRITWGSHTTRLDWNNDKFTLATRLRSEIGELELEILVLEENLKMNAQDEDVPVLPPEIRVQRQPTEFEILNLVQSDPEVSKANQQINRYEEFLINNQDQRDVQTRRDDTKRFQEQAEEWRDYLKTAEEAARVKVEQHLSELVERELAVARAEDERMRSFQVYVNRQKLKELKSKRKVLKTQYEDQLEELKKLGGASAELQFATEDLAVATNLLNKLRVRKAIIDLERHRTDVSIRTIASTTTPTSPVNSMPFEKAGWWAAAAFFVPFLLGYLLGIVAPSREPTELTDENEYLSLSRTQVGDVTALADLTNLKILELDNTQVSDVTPLAGLTNLEQLWLDNTLVSDVTALTGLTNLEVLSLSNTQVSDVTPLAGLTNLTDLEIRHTQVSDVTPLAGLSNLEELWLDGTQVSDVTALAGLKNLKELWLSRTQVSDVTALAGLSNLENLRLSETKVSDVTPLAGLTNLEVLSLSNTQVSDEDIEKLKQALPNCRIVH